MNEKCYCRQVLGYYSADQIPLGKGGRVG
ncbi:hypothetical protein M0804_015533 [Polistes exclamans]|nr:hypothetical protein M0804_015534 [Polistes exclamans]KAI4472983.1 hypothetical protein M0804_015533 [Polistes exclamans]